MIKKYLSLILALSITLGGMAAKTEAQIAPKPPEYDQEVAKAIHEFLNPEPEPIIAIEKSESAFMKSEREKKEAEAKRKASQKANVVKFSQTTIFSQPATNGDCWSTAERLTTERFGASQWPAMRELIRRESNCNPNARNPTSGACGVPQALPCSKMPDKSLEGQILWMLNYIHNRYSNPSLALEFHNRHNWY